MEKTFDIIIVGGGPAGYTAALYAARAGLSTLVLEKMAVGGQMTLTGDIDNYPGFDEGVDGFTLGMRMQTGAERFGAKTEYTEVTGFDFATNIKTVHTISGDFFAKTIVLSMGANPKTLGIEKEAEFTGRGIHYCAHCDGRFYKDKTVMVIGGGNSAVADALYLSRLCKKVLIVHRRDTLRAEKIYMSALKNAENIEFLWNSTLAEIVTEKRVTGAKIRNVSGGDLREIECDGIFVSIGRKPATEILGDKLALDKSGYIIADESTKTAIDGVFAVGDIRTKTLRQIVTATADGAVAAHFAEEYLTNIK